MPSAGIVAAGHPVSAEVGASVLREGGNAVDAAVAACLASWVAEPLLTGPAAGGYLLVAGAGEEPLLLDFFVAAPSNGDRAPLLPVSVSFGDAVQLFHAGGASVDRWGTWSLAELCAPAVRLAREGVPFNDAQAYVAEILAGILLSTPGVAALYAPEGRPLREGERFVSPELAETIDRLGADGSAPFSTGDLAGAMVAQVQGTGGTLTPEDLSAYAVAHREPVRVVYRGRQVLTNPPPSAGGVLLALALSRLDASGPGPPGLCEIVAAMGLAQEARTPAFDASLADPGFLEAFLARRPGATTHISAMDAGGRACSVTCTNGEGSGVVVPGTGIHLNNVMGEEDLSPQGFFSAPPGRRMPSMMAPTIVVGDRGVELALGSAGSNRIRSAILQTIVGVVDHGLDAAAAVVAPRVHFEDGTVFAEPGIDLDPLRAKGHRLAPFRTRNLFFGGVQAIRRDPATGLATGAGDPRRGGAAVAA